MPKSFHNDVFDKGLAQVSDSANWGGGVLSMVLCAGAPATVSEASTLFGAGGKRVSGAVAMAVGDFTLADKAGGGREVSIGAKSDTAGVDVPAIDQGTATSATNNTLTDTAKAWTASAHVNKVVKITGGTGAGQTRIITANTATQLTVDSNWTTNPDATSTYQILEDLHIALYDGGATPRLLVVTNESSDQVITNANPINFPAWTFGFNDPV